jgi:hypothetical protein
VVPVCADVVSANTECDVSPENIRVLAWMTDK